MCGITGFLDTTRSLPGQEMEQIALRMAHAIRSRGPDDQGAFCEPASGLGLGFRRLAILDLSPTGRQPMCSADGRYTIIFNGEIYNFQHLRITLENRGHNFRGTSDTEVILAALTEWGLEEGVKLLNGMFAFAVWDNRESCLWLGRDRLGIKPVYYGWSGRVFLFGSELKALRAHPAWRGDIDRGALRLFMQSGCIPAPYSIYTQFHKLPPGCLLRVPDSLSPGELPDPISYWTARSAVENALAVRDPDQPPAQAVEALHTLLLSSVKDRMISDVPLGAFLSGGIDSTTIVALMQAQSNRPVRTFTIGFGENDFDEARHARRIAQHLGTDHTELHVSSEETLAVIPNLPDLYDEPFADSSQVPTHLVAKLARRYVTVSLSGDGGDELFAGYNRYLWGGSLWQRARHIPRPLRQAASAFLSAFGPEPAAALLRLRGGQAGRQPELAEKVRKAGAALPAGSPEGLYRALVTHWNTPPVLGGTDLPTLLDTPAAWPSLSDPVERMMYLDLVTYLPDDILTKVDRATMGASLESRAPFLDDFRLLDLAWQMPLDLKIRNGQNKWILRQVLYKYVPSELVERPKQGFALPFGDWLRGPLRPWAEALLDPARLSNEGWLDPAPIRKKWQEHLSGRRDWRYVLWDVLMFQAWLEKTGL